MGGDGAEISHPVPSCGLATSRPCPSTEGPAPSRGLIQEATLSGFRQLLALVLQAFRGNGPHSSPSGVLHNSSLAPKFCIDLG